MGAHTEFDLTIPPPLPPPLPSPPPRTSPAAFLGTRTPTSRQSSCALPQSTGYACACVSPPLSNLAATATTKSATSPMSSASTRAGLAKTRSSSARALAWACASPGSDGSQSDRSGGDVAEPYAQTTSVVRNTAHGVYRPQSAKSTSRRYRADCQRQVQASDVAAQRRRRRLLSANCLGPTCGGQHHIRLFPLLPWHSLLAPQMFVAPAATCSIGISPRIAIMLMANESRRSRVSVQLGTLAALAS